MNSYLVHIMIVMCYLVCHKCYAFSWKCFYCYYVNEHQSELSLEESAKICTFVPIGITPLQMSAFQQCQCLDQVALVILTVLGGMGCSDIAMSSKGIIILSNVVQTACCLTEF